MAPPHTTGSARATRRRAGNGRIAVWLAVFAISIFAVTILIAVAFHAMAQGWTPF